VTAVPARTAGVVSRMIAGVVDVAVAAGIVVGSYFAVTFFLFVVGWRRIEVDDLRWWMTTTSYLVVLTGYLFVCWATSGRTVGCVTMGLRVTRHSGERLHVVAALVRAWLCAVFPIGLLWVAVSPSRSSLHDLVVRSRVVYTHDA